MKFCKCGCGTPVSNTASWVKGHCRKGITHTEEAKEKIRQARLGKPAWNLGIPRTKEEKANMRASFTTDRKAQASARMKRRWEAGLYSNLLGDGNPSKRSEVSAKISEANRKRKIKDSTKEKIRQSRLGKPGPIMSEKGRASLSERMKINNPMYRKEVLDKHPVLLSGPSFLSEGENKLALLFSQLELEFKRQFKVQKDIGFYTVDFFFPDHGKIIEFDGHSSHSEFPEKDRTRDGYLLNKYGYQTLRILPQEINNTNLPKLIVRVKEFLNESPTS